MKLLQLRKTINIARNKIVFEDMSFYGLIGKCVMHIGIHSNCGAQLTGSGSVGLPNPLNIGHVQVLTIGRVKHNIT